MAITPEDLIDPIRYYKPQDPYYYEVDNLPLEDLLENDTRLLQTITSMLVWWPNEAEGTFASQAWVNQRVLGDLADVDPSPATQDQILAYDGAEWKPTSIGEGNFEDLGTTIDLTYWMRDIPWAHTGTTSWLDWYNGGSTLENPINRYQNFVFWRCHGENDNNEWGTFGNKFVVPLDQAKGSMGDLADVYPDVDYATADGFLSKFDTGDSFDFSFTHDCLVFLGINEYITRNSAGWANHPSLGYGNVYKSNHSVLIGWNTNGGQFATPPTNVAPSHDHYMVNDYPAHDTNTKNPGKWQYCHFFSFLDCRNAETYSNTGAGLWTQVEFSIKVKGDQDTEYSKIPILNIYQDTPDGLEVGEDAFGNGAPAAVHPVSGVNPIKLSTLISNGNATTLDSLLTYDSSRFEKADTDFQNFANLKGLSISCDMPSEFQNEASTSWVDAYLQVICTFHHHPNLHYYHPDSGYPNTIDISDEGMCGLGALFDAETRGSRDQLVIANQDVPSDNMSHVGDATRGFKFSISKGIHKSGLNTPSLTKSLGEFDGSSY